VNIISNNKIALALSLAVVSEFAIAVDWTYQNGLELGVGYTDNLFFADPDDAQADTIGTIIPSVALYGAGRKSKLSLTADGKYQIFPDQETEDFLPRVGANLTLQLIDNLLYTELNANAGRVKDDADRIFDELETNAGDTETAYTGSIATTLQHTFDNLSDFRLTHTYAATEVTGGLENDTISSTSRIAWGHQPGSRTLGWNIEAQHQRTDFDQFDDSAEVYFVNGGFSYLATPELLFSASAGKEWTGFVSVDDKRVDNIWALSLNWKPNARHSLTLGYGERSLGTNPSFEYVYIGRIATLRSFWRRDYATNKVVLDNNIPLAIDGVDGAPAINNDNVLATQQFVDNQQQVDDVVGAELVFKGRLSEIILGASYLVRENRSLNTEVENALVNASFNRKLSDNTTWGVSYFYREQLPSTETISIYENRLQLSLKFTN